MSYEKELAFFKQTLQKMNIQTLIFSQDQPPEFPEGLEILQSMMMTQTEPFRELKDDVVYSIRDAMALGMYVLKLPRCREVLLVGPYLTQDVTEHDVMELMERCGLPMELLPVFRRFYESITFISDEGILLAMITSMAQTIWGHEDRYTMEYVESARLLEGLRGMEESCLTEVTEAASIKLMEERYAVERRLMYAVAHGQTHQAQMIISQIGEAAYEQRTADPLRNLKNYAIVCNTLMRKAAEEGQVHPLHIDKLSSTLARKIETLHTVDEALHFIRNMVHKYCLLVKNHSMKGYSQLVQHVILRVDSDLTADLSLKAHAEFLNVNPSYLSTLFRRETGMTLTEYVNRQRIEHGIFLLNATDMQVQTIAQYCGIPDVNYFTKTFKRLIGKTPKAYRADTRGLLVEK